MESKISSDSLVSNDGVLDYLVAPNTEAVTQRERIRVEWFREIA